MNKTTISSIYLILFFLFLNYLEIYIIRDNENLFPASGYYICTLPLAVSVFAFFLNHTNWGNGSIFENIGVNDSGNVYYFHVIVWTAFQRVVAIISPDTQPNNCLSMTYMGGGDCFYFDCNNFENIKRHSEQNKNKYV